MKKRNLGNTGTTVSAVGIGAMSFCDFYGPTDTEKSHAILRKALDLGIDHIDTSNVYGAGKSEERIGSFLKAQGARKNELFKIATNRAYTALRRGRRRASHNVALDDEARQIPAADPQPESWAVQGEALEEVGQAIAGLPPKQRMAVVLRYVQELDYAAIAQALECSQDSARANVYQALRRMRRLCREPAEEPSEEG